MKSIGQILQELGFNSSAPVETQKAFLRHLVRASEASLSRALIDSVISSNPKNAEPVQLSFDPEVLNLKSQS